MSFAPKIELSCWKVSIGAQTPVGPWAFSLGLAAGNRAQAETLAHDYVVRMCAYGTISQIRRVSKTGPANSSRAEVYTAIAGRGDRVPA